MSEKFKAIVIDNQNEKFSRNIKEINKSDLKDGNVLVKVDYSSLNYKDALILNDGGKIVRKFPFVPGIDFSGKVVESERRAVRSTLGIRAVLLRTRVWVRQICARVRRGVSGSFSRVFIAEFRRARVGRRCKNYRRDVQSLKACVFLT